MASHFYGTSQFYDPSWPHYTIFGKLLGTHGSVFGTTQFYPIRLGGLYHFRYSAKFYLIRLGRPLPFSVFTLKFYDPVLAGHYLFGIQIDGKLLGTHGSVFGTRGFYPIRAGGLYHFWYSCDGKLLGTRGSVFGIADSTIRLGGHYHFRYSAMVKLFCTRRVDFGESYSSTIRSWRILLFSVFTLMVSFWDGESLLRYYAVLRSVLAALYHFRY
ncbi:hypothetical protein AAG906_025797 [Vitis piasezkii]